jgi:lysozyme family protein
MDHIFKFEGGYVNHPKDPGGATNMGITYKTLSAYRGYPVTNQDVKDLTKEEAREIYRRNYWGVVKGDTIPYGLDLVVMDGAVNSGPVRGVKWLQYGVGAKVDGKVGPETILTCQKTDQPAAIEKACDRRMGFLQGLRTWKTFGRGWSRRVASVEAEALAMNISADKGYSHAISHLANKSMETEKQKTQARNAGSGQTAAVGSGGGGAAVLTDLPEAAVVALVLLTTIAVILLAFKTARRMQFMDDRKEAMVKAIGRLKEKYT